MRFLQLMRSAQKPPDFVERSTPPVVFCPTCACSLAFRGTFTRGACGDIEAAEWDQYECRACGRFEFRFRRPETGQPQAG